MPIYEFVCPDCGWEFEELLRNSAEADSTPCPACDSKYVLKKISVFSAKTNGSGLPPACTATLIVDQQQEHSRISLRDLAPSRP